MLGYLKEAVLKAPHGVQFRLTNAGIMAWVSLPDERKAMKEISWECLDQSNFNVLLACAEEVSRLAGSKRVLEGVE